MKKLALMALVLVGIGMSACVGNKQEGEGSVMVKVDTVHADVSGAALQFPGRVVSASEVNLSFKVPGTVLRVLVEEGAHVRKGQLLAELDPVDMRVQLNATEAEYAQVKADAERVMALYEEGGTTASAYDKARYGLRQMEAKLQNHRNQLSYTRIYAPFDGCVQKRYHEPREIVSAGLPILSVLSGAAPEVEVNLPAASYVQREQFASYTCTLDVLPGEQIPMTLVSILPQANANQLYTMRMRVDQGEAARQMTPGMSAWVSIRMNGAGTGQKRIASTAVLEQADKTYVYLYNKEKKTVKLTPVEVVSLHTDGTCDVEGKLADGDLIVVNGVHSLRDGQSVRLVPAVSKTNVGGLL